MLGFSLTYGFDTNGKKDSAPPAPVVTQEMIQQSVQAALLAEQQRQEAVVSRQFETAISVATSKADMVRQLSRRIVDKVQGYSLDPAFSREAVAYVTVVEGVLGSARGSGDVQTATSAGAAISQSLAEITVLYQQVNTQAALADQKRKELELAQATESGLAKKQEFQEALLAQRERTRKRLAAIRFSVAGSAADQAELDAVVAELRAEQKALEQDKAELARLRQLVGV